MKRFVIDKNMRFLFALFNVNETRALQQAKLPIDLFDRTQIQLNTHEYLALWQAIVGTGNDQVDILLKLVDKNTFSVVSLPIMAALYSANFLQFVQRISQYKPLIGPLHLVVDTTADSVTVGIYHGHNTACQADGESLPALIVAAEMLFLVKLIRDATGAPVVPEYIEMTHVFPPPDYAQFLAVTPVIGPQNSIRFAKQDALRPFQLADDGVWQRFEPELRQRLDTLGQLPGNERFLDKISAIMIRLLPIGRCTLENVADKACVSVRTLQRKLSAEGTQYQTLLMACRETLAKQYLVKTQTSMTEIAFLLGFEQPSSFSRAFQRWTGYRPELYRATFTESALDVIH